MKQKNQNLILGGLAVAVVALLAMNAGYLDTGTGLGSDRVVQTKTTYSYAGQNVKMTLESDNEYNGSSVDPVFYVYDEKPDDWDNCRVDAQSGFIDTGTSSSGTYTVQEYPGAYYVRGDLSSYYCDYFEITIPAEGDSTLSDYNAEPGVEKLGYIYADTASISDVTLGVSVTSNSTSDITYTQVATHTVSDDTGYILDELKLQEDGTYSFATDSDGDGIYDEGVNKIEIIVEGGGEKETWVPFDVAASVNEFSGDDEAELDFEGDIFIPEESTLSITVKVTCDQSLTQTGDADEYCGDTEDFIDSAILVDAEGTTSTFDIIG